MLLPKLFSDHMHKTRANLKLVIIGITLRDVVKDWEVCRGEELPTLKRQIPNP